ncbi:MAG: hypothetical protein QOC99_1296 [Acidobacteriota bacterium]|jgi:hypothetical protein|nr:hypothetical protein [Acidobacteriota bacterium]
MKERTNLRALFFCAAALAFTLCGGCAAPQQTAREQQPVAAQSSPAATSPAVPSSPDAQSAASPTPAPAAPDLKPPPQPSDVRAALERTYKGAVAFDEHSARVVAGDFNGDGSEDLMVEVRPAPGKVAALNDELSNWIVTDPLTVRPPDPRDFDPHQGVQKLKPSTARPHIEQNDALLVVIHGYKETGWRNPEAMQTYLLKNVSGTDLKAESRAVAQAAAQKKTPRLLGDVLEEKLNGNSGFLYWTGATYGWFH